jgi:hypothetical protein
MDRHEKSADSADDAPPSEAWLFAQAILGKPIPRVVSPESKARAKREELEHLAQFSTRQADELKRLDAAEAEARHDREILEWAAGISTRAEAKLRALQCKEAEEREAWRRAEQFAEQLLEGNWDPSKHPRLGGPPNAGWWAATNGGGSGAGGGTFSSKNASDPLSTPTTQSTRKPQYVDHSRYVVGDATTKDPVDGPTSTTTSTSHPTSKGVPVRFAAARSARGHHWIPRAVFGDLKSKMTDGAYKIFELGTKPTEIYDHGFDTWNGVTHDIYIEAMHQLLNAWIKARGGELKDDDAAKFLSWIATGKHGKDAFAAKYKTLFDTVFRWRKGFLQSIVVAYAAADINPKLTPAELKAVAQHIVNGAPTKPLSRAAAKAAQGVIAGGKPLLRAVAKRILPGLTFLTAAMAAGRGWAGQGHTGDGAWGAFNETMRDLMIADVVEPIAFPTVLYTVDGLTNLLIPGLNAPGKNRYIWRGGRLYDLETGRIID